MAAIGSFGAGMIAALAAGQFPARAVLLESFAGYLFIGGFVLIGSALPSLG